MSARQPIFSVPAVVLAACATIVTMHVVQEVLPPEHQDWLVGAFGFIPARYTGESGDWPGGMLSGLLSPLTHMLVHGDWEHLLINSAGLLAFGRGIAMRLGALRFILFSCFAGLAGALLFWLLNPDLEAPVIGASGAITGMFGATMRYFFAAMDDGGFRQLRDAPETVPLMPLAVALRDRRVVLITGLFLIANVLAFFGIGSVPGSGPVAWEAHLGGYLAGLLGFGFFGTDEAVISQPHNKPTLH